VDQNVEHVSSSLKADPLQFDWRTKNVVSLTNNQGQCGGWAIPIVENIESIWMITHSLTIKDFPPLAIEQIYDCAGFGCNGGLLEDAYKYVVNCGGLESNESYNSPDGTCRFDAKKVAACISGYRFFDNTNEDAMRSNLVSLGPLVICVNALSWQFYTGGIMMAAQCDSQQIDHCVVAVGYDLTGPLPYWSIRNSWGTAWGEKGYIRVQYGKNTCGLVDDVSTGVAKTSC